MAHSAWRAFLTEVWTDVRAHLLATLTSTLVSSVAVCYLTGSW